MVKIIKTNNFNLYLVIGILAFAIIVGTLVGSSYNREFFADGNEKYKDNKLIYLYMKSCPACQGFNSIWSEIEGRVSKKSDHYKFITVKYDLMEEELGKKYATDLGINYAPAIIFYSGGQFKGVFSNCERNADKILEWAKKLNT